MTLTIHKEEDEQRQLTLTVDVSEERVRQAMRAKARELARDIRIPGFRRGKAPYGVIERRVGRETLRAETVEDLVQPVFQEALSQAEAEAYGQPALEDMQMEPLRLTFLVPLEPVVKLGDYRSQRKKIEPVVITDEAVEEALEQVQTRHQDVEPVDRPLQVGDVVTLGGKGELVAKTEMAEALDEAGEDTAVAVDTAEEASNEVIFDEESLELLLDEETLFPGTPFVDNLVGLSAGESTSFSFVFPDDAEDFAGRKAKFEISVLDVKERELPPLDDELAKLEGDYETLEELQNDLRSRLQEQAESQAREDLIEEWIETLLEDAELNYPPAAVEMQIDEMISSFRGQLSRSGWNFDDYLQLQGMMTEDLREDFRENAENRLEHSMVLRQFVLDEYITVEAEDLDELIEERVSRFENEELRENMRNFFRSGQGFDTISSEVLTQKVYERIQAIYAGEAPSLEMLAAQTEARDEEE